MYRRTKIIHDWKMKQIKYQVPNTKCERYIFAPGTCLVFNVRPSETIRYQVLGSESWIFV